MSAASKSVLDTILTMWSLPDSFVSLFPDELAATDCVADPLKTQHP